MFFKLSNPSGRTKSWGLKETSTRKKMFLGSRARQVRRATKLIAICEPIV
jgi:hypothetical protein